MSSRLFDCFAVKSLNGEIWRISRQLLSSFSFLLSPFLVESHVHWSEPQVCSGANADSVAIEMWKIKLPGGTVTVVCDR